MRPDIQARVSDVARLEAVERSALAATSPEEAFDRLSRLAASVLDVPLAFVTIVDEKRSWYKSCVGLPEGVDRFGPVEESFCQYVIGSGAAFIVDDAAGDDRTRDNPAIDTLGVRAWAGYPVRAPDGEILGTFCVVDNAARHWTERDIEVLDTLAQAASGEVALRALLAESGERLDVASQLVAEVAVSAQRSAELARTLQQSLLPPALPDVPGLEVWAEYLPAATGDDVVGDFYDVFEGVSGTWWVAIGDVCGKGPEAASITGLARWTLRAVALRTTSPAKVLSRLNEVLLHQHRDNKRHITVAVAAFRRRHGKTTVTISSAGHPLPLLRRADGTVSDGARPGMPAGWFDKIDLSETRHDLEPGDSVVFVTDGVTEARTSVGPRRSHDDEFGIDGVERVVASASTSPRELVCAVMSAVEEFRSGPPQDDTAVLVARVTGDRKSNAMPRAI